jgi:hypothetical protein
MFTRSFHPRPFLRSVYGTAPFVEYCALRGIAFRQSLGAPMTDRDFLHWQVALLCRPETEQARVELELSQVNDLAHAAPLALLLDAVQGWGVPPAFLPGGPPLALHFFLHHPDLFQEVFLQQEIGTLECWRTATAPAGLAPAELLNRRDRLAESLKEFFRIREGRGQFCAVEAYELQGSACFVAYLSDRLQLLDVFTDEGTHTTRPARPAFALVFAYDPADGRILLRARQRSREKVLDLVRRFGRSVLGNELPESCLPPGFRLDVLKRPFDPAPDGADMERVRVRSLHLAYPGRDGRRRVLLETLAGDGPRAIPELLREHGGAEHTLEALRVLYAELEITLQGRGRRRTHVIRLWPDRTSLPQTALGERFRACLKRWGIADAG